MITESRSLFAMIVKIWWKSTNCVTLNLKRESFSNQSHLFLSSSSLRQTCLRRLVDEIDLKKYVSNRIDDILWRWEYRFFFFFLLHVATT